MGKKTNKKHLVDFSAHHAHHGGGSSQWIHGPHKATDPNIAKGCRIKINGDRMGCV